MEAARFMQMATPTVPPPIELQNRALDGIGSEQRLAAAIKFSCLSLCGCWEYWEFIGQELCHTELQGPTSLGGGPGVRLHPRACGPLVHLLVN